MNAAAPALVIRTAASGDIPMLGRLIERSARALSRDHYTDAQIEAAILHVFAVDSALIDDGTYLVAEWDGMLAGCGGWSARATLFGGDRFPARSDTMLDPAVDAARIRAFFVDEGQTRRGVAYAAGHVRSRGDRGGVSTGDVDGDAARRALLRHLRLSHGSGIGAGLRRRRGSVRPDEQAYCCENVTEPSIRQACMPNQIEINLL